MSDNAWIRVGGRRFEQWTAYSIQQDITTPSDGFRFETTTLGRLDEVHDLLSDGAEVEIGVDLEQDGVTTPVVQMAGVVTRLGVRAGRSGTFVEVEGLDKSSHLAKNSADFAYRKDEAFADLAKRAVEPWGIEVTHDAKSARDIQTGRVRLTSAQQRMLEQARYLGIPASSLRRDMMREADKASQGIDVFAGVAVNDVIAAMSAGGLTPADLRRLRVEEAKPEYAETIWQYLSRHAQRLGIFMRMSAEGRLILSVPDYTQPPSYALRRGETVATNVIEGAATRDSDSRFTEVRVHGTTKASANAPRRKSVSTVYDDRAPLPFQRMLAIHDSEARTDDELERRALRELAQSKQGYLTYDYTVQGHGQGGLAYAADTIAAVHDEMLGVFGRGYVRGRSLEKTKDQGTVTRLTIVPPYSIVP